ncbi:MAG: phenylalanine--tRNA ligase subunit beta [Proteobacteria bacterium]|nr:phenylalanine--tRNA ligase subunit beta [Pseudomonadota bacterium]
MKFTLSWLKEHLETTASAKEIAEKLTWLGLEVESLSSPVAALAPFIVAYVESTEKHPNADRLKLCIVDTGREKVQVVCGAPNARAGMKGVFAAPGTVIPASGTVLKISKIREVESRGMLCSAKELLLSEEHEGIIELPADAPVGKSFVDTQELDDAVFEVKLTPNRPDCFGVYGIARDLAASGLGRLKPRKTQPVKGKFKSPRGIKLDFGPADKNACPYFIGRTLRGLKNGPSVEALQRKLKAIGLRPISALVDITNYLTFDAARPLHVFDAAKVKGDVHARPARAGEKLLALNGKEYVLDESITIIADDEKALAIAGIMGGMETGCTEMTTEVFLECATFDPVRTARAGRKLQIISDARTRFERGVDPAIMVEMTEWATQLILEACGGEASEVIVAGVLPDTSRTVFLRATRCKSFGGLDVPPDEQKKLLEAVGCEVKRKTGFPLPLPSVALAKEGKGRGEEGFEVTFPSSRPDLEGEADCVEEILRLRGFDQIPALSLPSSNVMPAPSFAKATEGLGEPVRRSFSEGGKAGIHGRNLSGRKAVAMDPSMRWDDGVSFGWNLQQRRRESARKALAARGLLEVVTWSFMPSVIAKLFLASERLPAQSRLREAQSSRAEIRAQSEPQPILLQNPISAELDAMRGSILPNLLMAARRNADRGFADTALFEVGSIYRSAAPEGQIMAASGLRTGLAVPRHWAVEPRAVDLFDAKADALAALEAVGVPLGGLQAVAEAPAWYHPGRSGVLKLGATVLAHFGELHPAILKKLEVKTATAGFEVFFEALPPLKETGPARPLLELPDLQPVRRDFAFVLDRGVEAEKLVKAIRAVERQLIAGVEVFDVYEGANVAPGQKSLALEVRFQPREKTLTEAELEALSEKIIAAAHRAAGAVLRK